MLDIFSSVKEIKGQTGAEKMHVLKMIAYQMLGGKWVYYRKIKRAGQGHTLFREKSIMDQMKATQSALKFTSRSAKNQYRSIYKSCLQDIATHTGQRKEQFPELPPTPKPSKPNEVVTPPGIDDEHDHIIISWTPLKFLSPARIIRKKGQATQRHSEGLVAKLFFKVLGYYATSENWDPEKLTLYLRHITEKSTFSDVTRALNALKRDLTELTETYDLFKFGTAKLSKDATSDEDAFDDAMGVESADDQVKTLYWYNFIYAGMEAFLFKYYLVLVTSTNSQQAVRYITQLFKPALAKAIEINIVFWGSFETDASKKKFRGPFNAYKADRAKDPLKKKIKTAQGIFEAYNYTLKLIGDSTLSFELSELPDEQSAWGTFIKDNILNSVTYGGSAKEGSITEPINPECRHYALMCIINILIACTQNIRMARHEILERFRKRVEREKELAAEREKELRRQAERKLGN